MQVHCAPFVQQLQLRPPGRSNTGSLRFRLAITLCMLTVKYGKFDWLRVLKKLDQASGCDSRRWPKGAPPLGTRMPVGCVVPNITVKISRIVLKSFIKMPNILQLKQPNINQKNHFFILRKSTKYLRDKIHSWYCVTFM